MAANPTATLATADGMAKRVHGKMKDLVTGKHNKFTSDVKLDRDNPVGAEYYEPVFLTGEHGATFTGNSGASADLNGAEVAISKPAVCNPCSIWFQTRVVIDSVARMIAKGEQAFENYMTVAMRNTRKGLDKRLEIVHTNGLNSLGVTESASAVSGTVTDLVISEATWAPHIWLNMINCPLDAYDSTDKLNDLADLKVTRVYPKTRTVRVSGNSTDATAIVSAGAGTDIYFKGYYGNTGVGLLDICQLNSSDTDLFSIDPSEFPDVWCATQVTWNGTDEFTWELINSGVEEALGRGLDTDLKALVPYGAWNDLSSSVDAMRMFDASASVSKVELGHDEDAISYRTLGIKVKIVPSGFQRGGAVCMYPDDSDMIKLVGSTAPTFSNPIGGEEMVYQVQGTNNVEWCAYTNQSLYTSAPRNFVYIGS